MRSKLLWGVLVAGMMALPVLAGEPPETGLVVDFVDGTTQAQIDTWEQAWDVDLTFNSIEGPLDGIAVAQGAAMHGHSAAQVLTKIRENPAVESAEPLQRLGLPDGESEDVEAAGPAPRREGFPNDPEFDRQWNLKAIHAPEAWARGKAHGKGVIVAVIDTGIAYENRDDFFQVPDLAEARFIEGYDFVHDTKHANDDHGHGTHVAGTIAQSTHNGVGVAGVAFEATLMPIKVLDHFGSGNSADISDAIRFAADHGARVLNLSLGGGLASSVMQRAVRYAREKGAVVVCAAGNTGRGLVEYPAAYPESFAVAAVGPDGKRAPYSSYGDALDIAAPGGNKALGVEQGILQNTLDPRDTSKAVYAWYQGTSMAAPHVAGVAALLFAEGGRSPDQVEAALQAGATKVPLPESSVPLEEQHSPRLEYGAGLLDADGALKQLERLGQGALSIARPLLHCGDGWRAAPRFEWNVVLWVGGLLALTLLSLPVRRRIGYLNALFSPGFLLGVGGCLFAWYRFSGSSEAHFTVRAWSLIAPALALGSIAFLLLSSVLPSLRRFAAGACLALAAVSLQLMGTTGWPLAVATAVLSLLIARLRLRRFTS